MSRLAKTFVLLTAMVLARPAFCEKPDLPTPTQYVVDYAHVMSEADKNSLLGVLQELEQKTGAQYIVLTVNTTEGIPIRDFSIKLAEKWKLGQKGKDNGFLFTIAIKDREYGFEVGKGLEGDITDLSCGRIGRDVLVPYLKRGDYSGGIKSINLDIASRIAKGYGVTLSGVPAPSGNGGDHVDGGRIFQFLVPGFIILVWVVAIWRGRPGMHQNQRYYRGPRWPGPGGFGGFGGGFGGFGGGGGGGFGGFGGGGGGSFGGGGASGHW
jgi:uncharacterized protein